MKTKLAILFLLFTFIITSGFGCKGVDKVTEEAMKPITLNYWRVWDDADAFSEIISAYTALHPYVTINYRKLRYEEYEQALLEALAEDRAPDIISLHNTWMQKYESKLAPMPEKTAMAYPVEKGTIKKEIVYELKTENGLALKDVKNNFIDTVYNDVVMGDKIYGLPLSVDTLALYYNKDLFNNAGIVNPPEFWNKDFQENVKKLTKIDKDGNILQSGIALGGGANIDRSSDILSILMMQNGATMMNGENVSFHSIPTAYASQKFNPGLEALRFYTDFANPTKEVYCWNSTLENSVDMFVNGKLAMMPGYAFHLPTVKAKGAKLNFVVVPLPQIEGGAADINYANYWVEAVSKKSANIETAWNFLQFAAKAENAKSYLNKTKKPAALRSLIEDQLKDPELDVFAGELLTAKSWYKGNDSNAMEEIMKEMISAVVANPENAGKEIGAAAGKVQQTIK
jgi:multiple sugar transport system substrate-binding protein